MITLGKCTSLQISLECPGHKLGCTPDGIKVYVHQPQSEATLDTPDLLTGNQEQNHSASESASETNTSKEFNNNTKKSSLFFLNLKVLSTGGGAEMSESNTSYFLAVGIKVLVGAQSLPPADRNTCFLFYLLFHEAA